MEISFTVVGGLRSELSGGRFRDGALGALAAQLATPTISQVPGEGNLGKAFRTMIAAALGGAVSESMGGDFGAGALSAAFTWLFNHESAKEEPSDVPKLTPEEFKARYGKILEATDIDIDVNVAEAEGMTLDQFINAVKANGDWDYKNDPRLYGKFSATLLDEFGNVHFGLVANAFGFNLATALTGAGAYQVLFQGSGSPSGLVSLPHPLITPDALARSYTEAGSSWGDNPGDAMAIMRGYDYYEHHY